MAQRSRSDAYVKIHHTALQRGASERNDIIEQYLIEYCCKPQEAQEANKEMQIKLHQGEVNGTG